jgi:GNAT superfamily N-acetyltransferase
MGRAHIKPPGHTPGPSGAPAPRKDLRESHKRDACPLSSGTGFGTLQRPMPVEIRRAKPEEAAEVADVFVASQADALPFLRALHSTEDTIAFITEDVFTKDDVWIAIENGKIVGMMALAGTHIDHLYLQPGYYRRGIGSQLIEKAKELHPLLLTLYAFQVNLRARSFYEEHGFVPIEFGDGSGNEAGEPDVLYEWRGAAT